MEFYIYLNGARRGPFPAERVQTFLAEGLLQPSDLASDQPDSGWKPLFEFSDWTTTAPQPLPDTETFQAPAPEPRWESAAQPIPLAPLNLPALPLGSLGPYSRSTLAPDETPYFKTSLHWIVFVGFAGVALLVFLLAAIPFAIAVQALTGSELGWFLLPLPAFIMLPPTVAFASSELVITDRRMLVKTGIVRRQTLEMFISKIESIAVEQGFLGRLFDYGTVVIRGSGGFEEAFEAIAQPALLRNCVQRLQSGMRSLA
ncbi:MAG: PH domain-containing protein [Chthoniobacterales bacterium]